MGIEHSWRYLTNRILICYNTSMKNKTMHNFITTGVLAIMLFSAQSAFAYVSGVWEFQPRTSALPESPFIEAPVTVSASTTTQSSTQSTATSSSSSNTTQTQSQAKKTTTVAKKVPVASTAKSTTQTPTENTLTASAAGSSSNFMPDTILEWIFVVLLIAAIIILSRKITQKPAPHGAPAH